MQSAASSLQSESELLDFDEQLSKHDKRFTSFFDTASPASLLPSLLDPPLYFFALSPPFYIYLDVRICACVL